MIDEVLAEGGRKARAGARAASHRLMGDVVKEGPASERLWQKSIKCAEGQNISTLSTLLEKGTKERRFRETRA